MHELLELKGTFSPLDNDRDGGGASLPVLAKLEVSHLKKLIDDLERITNVWDTQAPVKKIMIDVNYIKLVSKSNRIHQFFRGDGNPNLSVVGARFSEAKAHIITHYVSKEAIRKTITDLNSCISYIDAFYFGTVDGRSFKENYDRDEDCTKIGLKKSPLRQLVADSFYVDSFSIPKQKFAYRGRQIVTFYKTEQDLYTLLTKLGIEYRGGFGFTQLDETSVVVSEDGMRIIEEKIPYLIAMSDEDFMSVLERNKEGIKHSSKIPHPADEPWVGVIDTPFDEGVYFSEWVENHDMIDPPMEILDSDKVHGTKVSSIIVDGEFLNEGIGDGCGRFRVKHFGVIKEDKTSSAVIMKKIREIVKQHPEIHVWNLSLGGIQPVSQNYISYEASILDEIQHENNCVFVVCGTNDKRENPSDIEQIAAPADSLNSLVVNAISAAKVPASYSRKGPVLSYFTKPDVAYYGGDSNCPLVACSPTSDFDIFSGTSAAAPWISRKLAYLIEIMNLPREVAKALIIDSAAGWSFKPGNKEKELLGYGIVPQTIQDLLSCPDDEIKFFIKGKTLAYKTYNYQLPIPKDNNGKYPFLARATMCYFPKCYRQQGVDYTETELQIKFGRLDNKGKIKSVEVGDSFVTLLTPVEKELRELFHKWENTKHLCTPIKTANEALKSYEDKMWGIEITTSERIDTDPEKGLLFGLVVTLKEINGDDRFNVFLKECSIKNWVINPIKIQNRVTVYVSAQQDLDLHD